MNVLCKICNQRRARRHCPGAGAEICPQCCGAERENTIDCPSDCEHLRAARRHEQLAPIQAADVPNRDIHLEETFVRKHDELIAWLTSALAAAMEKERAVDFDAREALEAMIKTYRTLESGLIYETKPPNPYAASIQQSLQESLGKLREHLREATGSSPVRDRDVLGALVFLQRLELQHNNGRRRGRAFYDFMRGFFPAESAQSVIA
ncbi:MAG TPA: hypothetical protein VKS01_01500 [Bryobacteraceae bacterium]|nr:hypothetical protein [Bryobacteraceae bacterium]